MPIFASLEALDRRLEALDLREPLAGVPQGDAAFLPGVIAASSSSSSRRSASTAPLLVGGVDGTMFGNAIADQFGQSLNWLNGSVLSFFLLVVVAVLMGVFARFLTVRRVATG